mgnify:CR=1 FL=1
MDRLRVKLKKILNKDVTSLLNKYKIPLVSLALVVVLVLVEPHILQHLAHIAVQAAAVAGTVAVAGWYGGGGGGYRNSSSYYYYGVSNGGGGSGFVYTSGVTLPTGYLLGADYQLTSAQTIAGNTAFTSPTGGTETGHAGNGYAKVTFVGQTLE